MKGFFNFIYNVVVESISMDQATEGSDHVTPSGEGVGAGRGGGDGHPSLPLFENRPSAFRRGTVGALVQPMHVMHR